MIGLKASPSAFFLTLFTVFLVEQCSCAFGTMISASTPTFYVALTVIGPLLIIVRLTAGLMANVAQLPVYISWLQYLSWWRYGYEALSAIQWHSVKNISCEALTQTCVKSGDEVLSSLSFSAEYLWRDLGMTAVLTICFYAIGSISIWITVFRAR